ncbi:hypothetical protein [Mycolicibacterium palauense]|uniref:hypothetical protein n=1 Tax=Mycolicibacterium palauense TaxID=2034511 RepID=UPI0011459016|nr:hypothetical protein [Mycolicibacterium palauense]
MSDFRFQWSAEPDINLTSGEPVPVRAYLESWLLVRYTNNLDAAYPGYVRATPPSVDAGAADVLEIPYQIRDIRGLRAARRYFEPGQRISGNEELHILHLDPLAAGFRAIVCDATYHVYRQAQGSTDFVPLMFEPGLPPGDAQNMTVRRIDFSNRDPRSGTTNPASPAEPQEGPLPEPRTDVFGPWFVTGAEEFASWDSADLASDQSGSSGSTQSLKEAQAAENALRQQCLDRYPLDAADRDMRGKTVLTTAPPVEPAVPGWPE